jgi:hypothetical protein
VQQLGILFGFPQVLTAWLEPPGPGTYHPEIRIACRIKHPLRNPTWWNHLYTRLQRRLVDAGCFGLQEPGDYAGTLVLSPDPNYAYEDPAIKAIWNGTLEFPISFSVYHRLLHKSVRDHLRGVSKYARLCYPPPTAC